MHFEKSLRLSSAFISVKDDLLIVFSLGTANEWSLSSPMASLAFSSFILRITGDWPVSLKIPGVSDFDRVI